MEQNEQEAHFIVVSVPKNARRPAECYLSITDQKNRVRSVVIGSHKKDIRCGRTD